MGPVSALSAGAVAMAAVAVFSTPATQTSGARAVDGDTIRTAGITVRVIGIDTPERGECGYAAATRATQRLVRKGVKLHNRGGVDRYGRTLASVRLRDGRDLGSVLLRRGLAIARYDSTDGYQWHRQQRKYHRLDAANPQWHNCPRPDADAPGGPTAPSAPTKVYYPNCDAVRAAGAAPLLRGERGYRSGLDADGDGIACE